jgi:hypothetical protein
VLTEGDYRWSEGHIVSNAAPPALLDAFSDQPRWVDMRFARTDEQLDLRNASFRAAVADIAAPIRGIPKDELESEEVRQHRRTVRTVWAAGIALLLFAVLASGAAVYAIGQQNRAEAAAQEAELATLISRSAALADEDPEASVLLALEAHRRSANPETEQAVMNALGASTVANRISTFDDLADVSGPCPFGTIHSNGLTLFAQVDGQLVSSDLSTGEVAEHGPSPGDCVDWMQDDELNRRVAEDRSGHRLWFGPAGGPWEVEREFDDPTTIIFSSFRPNHRLIALSETSTGPVVGLIDDRTGESVGPQHSGGRDFFARGASPDGRFFVASLAPRTGQKAMAGSSSSTARPAMRSFTSTARCRRCR